MGHIGLKLTDIRLWSNRF